MQEIIQQVGTLLLGALPTTVLFAALVICYQFLVQRPLTATLAERRARTDGAMEEAAKAIARADTRANEYAERLRLARQEVFKVRELRVKQLSVERDAVLDEARKATGVTVAQARAEIDSQAAQAKQTIQASAGELAALVARAVLPQAAGGAR